MRKKEWVVLVCALFVGGAVLCAEDTCQLPEGLFERRSALVARVGSYEGETYQSRELKSINEKYFQLMSRLENSAKPGATQEGRECCGSSSHDPVASLVCKLTAYLASGRKQGKLLLESVPTGPQGREALWALDEIAHLHDSDNHAVLFGPYGPVTLYLDELYRLIRSGNEEALSKYLGLYPHSDGEHGEQMDDQMKKLMTGDTGLVLREWKVFEQHPKAFPRLRDSLTSGERKALKSKLSVKQECANGSSACAELTDALLRQ